MTRRLLPIFLVVLVDVFGMTLVFPLQPIYAEQLSATPLEATMLVSVYALFQLVCAPLLGRLSDRFGRKPILLLSQLGTCVGFVVMARARTLGMLYLARMIDGATAGNLALAQAYMADATPPERRTSAFALIGAAFGIGYFIGPVVTASLVTYGIAAPIWGAAGLSALSMLGTLTLLPGGGARSPSEIDAVRRPSIFAFSTYTELFSRPGLSSLLWQFWAYVFSFAFFTSGFALFAQARFTFHGRPFGVREVGYTFAYAGLLGIVMQGGLIRGLVARFGDARLAAAGFGMLTVSYAALSGTDGLVLLAAVITVASFGNGLMRPTLTSLVSRHAGADEQGLVLGVTQSLTSLASIIGPIAGGFIIGRGPLWSWPLGCAAAALLGLWAARRDRVATAAPRDAQR